MAARLVEELAALAAAPPVALGPSDRGLIARVARLANDPRTSTAAIHAGVLQAFARLGTAFPVEAVEGVYHFTSDRPMSSAFAAAGGADVALVALERVCVPGVAPATFDTVVKAFSQYTSWTPSLNTAAVLARVAALCEARRASSSGKELAALCRAACVMVCQAPELVDASQLCAARLPQVALDLLQLALKSRVAASEDDAFLAFCTLSPCISRASSGSDVARLVASGLIPALMASWQRFGANEEIATNAPGIVGLVIEASRRDLVPAETERIRRATIEAGFIKEAAASLLRSMRARTVATILGALNECVRDSDEAKAAAHESGVIKSVVSAVRGALAGGAGRSARHSQKVNFDALVVVNGTQLCKTFCSGGSGAAARQDAFVIAGGVEVLDATLASPLAATDASLRETVLHAKELVSSVTSSTGRGTLVWGTLPCSNPGCERPMTSRCSRCAVPYCSPDCQRAHWPKHKAECKARAAALVR